MPQQAVFGIQRLAPEGFNYPSRKVTGRATATLPGSPCCEERGATTACLSLRDTPADEFFSPVPSSSQIHFD